MTGAVSPFWPLALKDCSALVAKGGRFGPSALAKRSHHGLWLDPELIVDRTAELLLASQIALGRLNRDVPQEELDLIEFAASQMTEPGARTPKIFARLNRFQP